MTRSVSILAMLALGCCASGAFAAEQCPPSLGDLLRATRSAAVPYCCPDDYCAKPMPCIACLSPARCPDDYCPKPLPCVPCVPQGGCPDCYCPKPLPNFCWPVNCPLYRCPPADCCQSPQAAQPAQ